jgi:hypothetical protein
MKILFVSTEIWSEKNPEGIVARKIVCGLIENDCQVDLITTKSAEIKGIRKEIIMEDHSSELFSKVKKKLTGIEKRDFVKSVAKFIKSLSSNGYDAIITRSEPFYVHETGFLMKQRFPDIKWIASFGDPVFLNPYNSRHILKRSIAKRLEQKYWRCADFVTHTNDAVIAKYVANGFDERKAIVLENPFSPSGTIVGGASRKDDNVVTLAYIGSLYGKRSIKPVAKFLSNAEFDFRLVIIGGVRNSYYENRFGKLTRLLFAKDMKKILQPIEKYGLRDKVNILPFMDKNELDHYVAENIDVLINIDAYVGKTNLFLSSKVVEYLQYGKPILNFSVDGASVDFLKSVGVDFYVDLAQSKSAKICRERLLNLIPSKNIERYTSREVCRRLTMAIFG